MSSPINVSTASYAIAKEPDSLSTLGVGSCIVICLYAADQKIGALLHCMLPREESDTSNPYRCVDTAISQIVVELLRRGITTPSLTAKLVGGSQMFPSVDSQQSIGEQNIEQALRILKIMEIPVLGTDLGGSSGRSVIFDLNTGSVSIVHSLVSGDDKLDSNGTRVL
jgi:chemotaxis protein CheD